MSTTSLGFLVSLAVILALSRKSLPAALIGGALSLGLITLPVTQVIDLVAGTLSDPGIIMLALAMGVIPVLGGTMKDSGQVDALINNVRLNRRYLLPFSAALMGLLPMPGGALLSAPIVEKGGAGVDDRLKAVINNWFRHLFILVYPLSPALIVAAKICELDIYRAIIFVIPGFLLATALGHLFYLRRVTGRIDYEASFSWRSLSVPLLVILAAPLVDFGLKRLFGIGTGATLIGVTCGVTLSIILSKRRLRLKKIVIKMKPWNFALIIIGTFLYLHTFQASQAGGLIQSLPLPPLQLAVVSGFVLALLTGRVQLPASIVFPVYLTSVGSITPWNFALIYIASYFGYITSPVHPCLVVTCEYFRVSIRAMIRDLLWPTVVVIGAVLVTAWVVG